MMKKIVSILLIVFILMSMAIVSKAVELATVGVSVGGNSEIEEGTKTVFVTINLGAFSGVQEGTTLGYETVLSYNEDAISSVVVEPLNGWTADYNTTTKKILGTVTSSQANKSIVKVTFNLKDNVAAGTDLKIQFKNFNITDDDALDITLDLSKPITIKAKPVAQVEQPNNQNPTQEQQPVVDNTNKDTNKNNNDVAKSNNVTTDTNKNKVATTNNKTDNTITAKSKLPNTGIKDIIITVILVIAVIGIASFVRNKSIKLK